MTKLNYAVQISHRFLITHNDLFDPAEPKHLYYCVPFNHYAITVSHHFIQFRKFYTTMFIVNPSDFSFSHLLQIHLEYIHFSGFFWTKWLSAHFFLFWQSQQLNRLFIVYTTPSLYSYIHTHTSSLPLTSMTGLLYVISRE